MKLLKFVQLLKSALKLHKLTCNDVLPGNYDIPKEYTLCTSLSTSILSPRSTGENGINGKIKLINIFYGSDLISRLRNNRSFSMGTYFSQNIMGISIEDNTLSKVGNYLPFLDSKTVINEETFEAFYFQNLTLYSTNELNSLIIHHLVNHRRTRTTCLIGDSTRYVPVIRINFDLYDELSEEDIDGMNRIVQDLVDSKGELNA